MSHTWHILKSTYIYIQTYAHIHIYTDTYTYTYVHAYTYIPIHTYILSCYPVLPTTVVGSIDVGIHRTIRMLWYVYCKSNHMKVHICTHTHAYTGMHVYVETYKWTSTLLTLSSNKISNLLQHPTMRVPILRSSTVVRDTRTLTNMMPPTNPTKSALSSSYRLSTDRIKIFVTAFPTSESLHPEFYRLLLVTQTSHGSDGPTNPIRSSPSIPRFVRQYAQIIDPVLQSDWFPYILNLKDINTNYNIYTQGHFMIV